MHRQRRIVIWSTDVIRLMDGKPIGGIAVQMYFWAQAFQSNGWKVFSFAENAKQTIEKGGISFKSRRNIKRINALLEWWHAFYFILVLHPELIIYRGANRELLPLAIFSRLFKVKLVMFGASDVNFEPGKELVRSEFNRKCYHNSIQHIKYFVTQNQHQHNTLLNNYGKESLVLFNIWDDVEQQADENIPESDVVWIANFRRLKRAEWVLYAASQCPDYHFTMAGGGGSDGYFTEMKDKAETIPNLEFLGPKPFFDANQMVKRSKVLLCTSTFEGFPNTFLQAWSNGIPVISTVDPSNIIKDNGLGFVVQSEEELVVAIQKVLSDNDLYQSLRNAITNFFKQNHSAQSGYNKLIQYVYG